MQDSPEAINHHFEDLQQELEHAGRQSATPDLQAQEVSPVALDLGQVDTSCSALQVTRALKCMVQPLTPAVGLHFKLYMHLQDKLPREDLRTAWEMHMETSMMQITFSEIVGFITSIPQPRLLQTTSGSKQFSQASLVDVVVQLCSTQNFWPKIELFPFSGGPISEFYDTPRFHRLQQQCGANSFEFGQGSKGFLHDIVIFQDYEGPQYGLVTAITKDSVSKHLLLAVVPLAAVSVCRSRVRTCCDSGNHAVTTFSPAVIRLEAEILQVKFQTVSIKPRKVLSVPSPCHHNTTISTSSFLGD